MQACKHASERERERRGERERDGDTERERGSIDRWIYDYVKLYTYTYIYIYTFCGYDSASSSLAIMIIALLAELLAESIQFVSSSQNSRSPYAGKALHLHPKPPTPEALHLGDGFARVSSLAGRRGCYVHS